MRPSCVDADDRRHTSTGRRPRGTAERRAGRVSARQRLLRRHHDLRPDGSPHTTVVWVDVDDDGKPGFNTARGRAKPRHIERDPRVSSSSSTRATGINWVSVSGTATLVDEGADAQIDKLAKKYLDADTYPFRKAGEQRVSVPIDAREGRSPRLRRGDLVTPGDCHRTAVRHVRGQGYRLSRLARSHRVHRGQSLGHRHQLAPASPEPNTSPDVAPKYSSRPDP